MEKQYNQLLTQSRTVSDFFENVYAPTLQTLPWLAQDDSLKTVSEKVLGNIAFPSYELSNYKNKEENQETINQLRHRHDELESIYQQMQNELRPILAVMPPDQRSWENLKDMLPKWKNLSKSDLLPKGIHKTIHSSFSAPVCRNAAVLAVAAAETEKSNQADDILASLMAERIKSLHREGHSDHAIAKTFGSHGFWLDRGFLNTIRANAQ